MNSFRQVCDKPCANNITQAEWSPQHDLIAVVTSNGDVRLHRMYWQKVWVMAAKEVPACCLAWKSNGKLLAIGFGNGDVVIVEIEKASVIHTLKHKESINTLSWEECPVKMTSAETSGLDDFLPEIKKDELRSYLTQSDLLITDCSRYCYLTVGTSAGDVYLYLEGVLLILKITTDKYPLEFQHHSIVSTHLDIELGVLTIISNSLLKEESQEERNCSFYVHQFTSSPICDRKNELLLLSLRYCKLYFLVQRCEKIMKQMADASEDIALKINSKLKKLENLLDLSHTNVAAEFTLAYTVGDASAELQSFLTQNLTTKGLKQIEQNVQSAYTSMHSDINDELEIIVQHIMFHLLQLIGMAKWTERYEDIGLNEESIQNCFRYITQFSMKLLQLLETISNDMENFSVFFSWLTSLCFHFSGEAQSDFPKLSFEDYDIMIDFLEHRLQKTSTSTSSNYNMEKVSQFFRDDDLDTEMPSDKNKKNNIWLQFIESNPNLKDIPIIVTPNASSSLVELFSRFNRSYQTVFESVCSSLTKSVSYNHTINLFEAASGHEERCNPVFSFLRKPHCLYLCVLACTCDSDRMFVVKLQSSSSSNLSIAGVSIEPCFVDSSMDESLAPQSQYTMRSVQFYNANYMTLLFEELPANENQQMVTILAQLPLSDIFDSDHVFVTCRSDDSFIEKGVMDSELDLSWLNVIDRFSEQRRMENFHGKFISANGYTREVCALVSVSGRRVRIFDMTVSDEDQEESRLNDSSQLNVSKESVENNTPSKK